jgi:hypothetical protein
MPVVWQNVVRAFFSQLNAKDILDPIPYLAATLGVFSLGRAISVDVDRCVAVARACALRGVHSVVGVRHQQIS